MDIRQLTAEMSVAGQIAPSDLAEVKSLGFNSVICNRPDGEAPDQPTYAEIEAAAQAAGLAITYIPIVPGLAGMAEVKAFRQAMDTNPGPVLAYCRSGARSTSMYEAARQLPAS